MTSDWPSCFFCRGTTLIWWHKSIVYSSPWRTGTRTFKCAIKNSTTQETPVWTCCHFLNSHHLHEQRREECTSRLYIFHWTVIWCSPQFQLNTDLWQLLIMHLKYLILYCCLFFVIWFSWSTEDLLFPLHFLSRDTQILTISHSESRVIYVWLFLLL